jgi:polyphenol oxidase
VSSPLRWTLAHGVHLAFSTAADGDLRDKQLRDNWLRAQGVAAPCRVVKQVHGKRIIVTERESTREADGLVTADPSTALGVFGADCPGLCIAAPDAFGLAHCGWRGTAAGIVGSLVDALQQLSASPRSAWHAFIGPGISGDEYEVDAPVLTARAWPAAAVRPTDQDHAQLDVAVAIGADLAAAGIAHIASANCCTSRDSRLWSYRRRGSGLVQLLVAWRDERAS